MRTPGGTLRDAAPSDRVGRPNGFTMIEMMIVIGVIAMILAIAVPSIKRARTNSRIQAAKGQLELVASAVNKLRWDTGKWPNGAALASPGTTEMWSLTGANAGLLAATSTYGTTWRGPYLRKLPLDPWGMAYFFDPDYTIGGQNKAVVGSFGPNRVGRNVYDADDIVIVLN